MNFRFQNGIVVDCVGKIGGLVLLWKIENFFEILQYSNFHIHGLVSSVMEGK